jgi:ABC-2 type transport system permease protein
MINNSATTGFFHRMITVARATIWVEYQKIRHSKILWITTVAILFITLICGLFMYILKDPEQARRLGLLGAKAQIFGGAADWANFFNLILTIISMAGLVIFGFIFVWIFGREFSNKTVNDFLALPTTRNDIVLAKITTAAIWSITLILMVFIFMLIIGVILDLPGGSLEIILDGLIKIVITGLLSIPLCIPFGLIASVTRGYLPSVGCIFLVILLVQVINNIGYGIYFPWSIPLLYSGAAEALTGAESTPPGFISYILVILVGIISLASVGLWWRYADQT